MPQPIEFRVTDVKASKYDSKYRFVIVRGHQCHVVILADADKWLCLMIPCYLNKMKTVTAS